MSDFPHLSQAALIERMEKAADFGYDDEAVELNRRLAKKGQTWRWGTGDRVLIVPLDTAEGASS